MSDNNKKIFDFALKELMKTIEDMKTGKTPSISKDLKNIISSLNVADKNLKENAITEEDVDRLVNDLTKNLEKK